MSSGSDKKRSEASAGLSRRQFIASVGAGVVVTASVGGAGASPSVEVTSATDALKVTLNVNGRQRRALVEPRETLVSVLREAFGLTGTKVGCSRGECGACTVLIDGKPRYSCMTLAVEAEGQEITTVEGLMEGEDLGSVQQAFVEEDAFQCGFCTPGQIVAVEGLLRHKPKPTLDEIRMGVSGNLCRCGAYRNIFNAAGRAAGLRKS